MTFSMISRQLVLLVAAALLCVSACSKDVVEETSGGLSEDEASSVAEPEQQAAPSEPEAEPAAEEVPVAEDFQQQAESSINDENYRQELDQLAREIEEAP